MTPARPVTDLHPSNRRPAWRQARSLLLGLTLAGACATASAQNVAAYLQGGISGVGVGVSAGLTNSVRARAELNGGMKRTMNGTESGVTYTGEAKASDSGLYLDWYPAGGGFRLVGGVLFNRSKVTLDANASNGGTAEINGQVYALTGADAIHAEVKYPSTMPYVGMGWGMGGQERGFSFIADLGVAIGKPKGSLDASASLRAKIVAAGRDPDTELAGERSQLQDAINKAGVYPVLRVGVAYRF